MNKVRNSPCAEDVKVTDKIITLSFHERPDLLWFLFLLSLSKTIIYFCIRIFRGLSLFFKIIVSHN